MVRFKNFTVRFIVNGCDVFNQGIFLLLYYWNWAEAPQWIVLNSTKISWRAKIFILLLPFGVRVFVPYFNLGLLLITWCRLINDSADILHAGWPMCLTFAPFSYLPTCSFPFYIRMQSMLEDGLTKYRVPSDCTCYKDVNENILQTWVIMRRHAALAYYLWPSIYWSTVAPWSATSSWQAVWCQYSRPCHIHMRQKLSSQTVHVLKLKPFELCTESACANLHIFFILFFFFFNFIYLFTYLLFN